MMVRCEFKDGVEDVSCVLVYREYGNETILHKEFPRGTEFPAPVDVADPGKYTFAIFGKNSSNIDEQPFTAQRLQTTARTRPSPSQSPPTVVILSGIYMTEHIYCVHVIRRPLAWEKGKSIFCHHL